MTHFLKIEQQYLDNLLSERKKAEIRFNDRDYQIGDVLEFYNSKGYDGGDYVYFVITHIHSGLGMRESFVVLSVEKTVKPKEPK